MKKQRILSALIALPLFFALLFLAPAWALMAGIRSASHRMEIYFFMSVLLSNSMLLSEGPA